jgi:hypothetical protein
MPLMKGWALQDRATRTSALALRAAREQYIEAPGVTGNLYVRLSGMLCWDSSLICAWIAGGIDLVPPPNATQLQSDVYYHNVSQLGLVNQDYYANVFTSPSRASASLVDDIPLGSFLGFVTPNRKLAHVMLYVGDGLAAGSNNACIFGNLARGGWEVLDLRHFFSSGAYRNGTRLIYQPVEGQMVRAL